SSDLAGGNPHIHCARLAIVLDREASLRAVIRVLEAEFQFLFDVAAGTAGARAARRPAAASRLFGLPAAAEEGFEEIGEGMRFAEHLAHLVFGHRAEAALAAGAARSAAAEVDVPAAARLTRVEPAWALTGAGSFVRLPVGAQLVVF